MRRAVGLILAGLGAFLVVVAIAARAYLPGQVVKYPLNEYLVPQLVGHDVSYFSPSLVKPITGATMMVTSTVKGDAALGNSSTAVWDQFNYLYDQTNHSTFQYSISRLPFDRRTGELVNCCGANVGGNSSIHLTGLSGLAWPFGTQQRTYQYFDSTMHKAVPVRYAGTATVAGIRVYRFVEKVTGARVGTQHVPASIVGMPGTGMVALPEVYTATNTFFVDPTTGAQLNQVENQRLTLVDSSGTQRLLLLNGSLTFTPPSVQKVLNVDNKARGEITLLEVIIPLTAGILGVILLITGILLSRPRQEEQPDYDATETDAPALDPAR